MAPARLILPTIFQNGGCSHYFYLLRSVSPCRPPWDIVLSPPLEDGILALSIGVADDGVGGSFVCYGAVGGANLT